MNMISNVQLIKVKEKSRGTYVQMILWQGVTC